MTIYKVGIVVGHSSCVCCSTMYQIIISLAEVGRHCIKTNSNSTNPDTRPPAPPCISSCTWVVGTLINDNNVCKTATFGITGGIMDLLCAFLAMTSISSDSSDWGCVLLGSILALIISLALSSLSLRRSEMQCDIFCESRSSFSCFPQGYSI